MALGGPFNTGRFDGGRFNAGRFSAKFGEGGPVIGGVVFGARTLAGAGGVPAPSGASAISGGTAGGYTISGGRVVPVADGSAESGTLEFSGSGDVWTVTTIPWTFSARADQAEIEAAAEAAGRGQTNTILLRDGVATGDRVNITRRFSGRLTIRSDGWGAKLPGFDLEGSDNITLDGLEIERFYNGESMSQTTLVVHVPDTTGITISNCIIQSDPLAGLDFYTSAGVQCLTLIGTPAATPANDLTVTDCILRECLKPLRLTASNGCVFERNVMSNCYGSFGELQGDNWSYKDNRGSGIWAHGGGAGQVGPNNPGGDPGLYPYDWGDPHSSLFGTGSAGDNQVFMGNILVVGPERFQALGDYPGTGSGPKWNDPIPAQTITYSNVICKYNVLGVADNTGIVAGYMRDSVVANNTIFYDTDYATNPKPNIYYAELGENVVISHNVASTFTHGTTGATLGVDPQTYTLSHENICAMAAGQQGTQAGDALEYSNLFQGPDFTGITADNALSRFTPLPGGRLTSGPVVVGAVGSYYDFASGVETPPIWSKPITSTATGMPTARVVFGASDYTRLTDSTPPFMDMNNPDELTLILALRLDQAQDGQDIALTMAAGYTMVLRRLPQGVIRFYLEDGQGNGAASFDSSLTADSADGVTVWTISLRLSTYDVRVMKGTLIDPLVTVSTWTGAGYAVDRTTFDVMPTAGGTVECLWMSDHFLDLHDAAVLDQIVALDGLRPSYYTDGSALLGVPPKVYLTGNADAWNAPAGLNRGSAIESFAMIGAVSDALPVSTPAAMGVGDWSLGASLTPFSLDAVVVSLPDDGGSPITGMEYSTDGGLTWADLGISGIGTATISAESNATDFLALTDYDVQLRAVNALGGGAVSDLKTEASASSQNPETAADPGFDLPGAWDHAAEWVILGGVATLDHASGPNFRVLYANQSFLAPVDENSSYLIGVDLPTVTQASGRFRILIFPFVGFSAQPTQTLYDTGGSYGDPALSSGMRIERSFTVASGVTSLRVYFDSVTSGNQLTLDNLSIRKE